MPILGAHMSIAGGYYKVVDEARRCGCDCVQIFTKNNNQWRAKAIGEEDVALFAGKLAELRISHPVSHASYLINLASPNPELWEKSVAAMVVELERADRLGVPYVVVHPGSHTTATEEAGLVLVSQALDEVHRRAPEVKAQCLLENTAGQGSNLGWKFEHLGAIIAGVEQRARVGVCFDTCHAFAAGYPLADPADFQETWRQFDAVVGIERLKAVHLNDSKKELGSRVDRHEHIGRGKLGLAPFANLLNDRRFQHVPMYLETPKGEEEGEPLDVINLRTLRGLCS